MMMVNGMNAGILWMMQMVYSVSAKHIWILQNQADDLDWNRDHLDYGGDDDANYVN